MEMAFSWLGFVDFVRDVAFQIRFGVIAVLSGDNGGDFHGGMGEFPMTSLASGHVLETRFPEVFEKIADFPWYTRNYTLNGQCGNRIP
jgi:hypothetical protein